MNKADVDFLFWHAVSKMRLGAFAESSAIFHFIEDLHPDASLGRAYCFIRAGNYEGAASLLGSITKPNGRAGSIYDRLMRRCQQGMSHADH